MITHGEITVPITTLFDVYFLQALHESGIHALLCATSVCSVPLWFIIAQKKQPQRHRAHRGCTEKKPNRDFRAKPVEGLPAAHREVACLRQHVDGLRHLRIAHRDEYSIANHTSVSGGDDIEAKFEFDESTVSIDHRGRDFVSRFRGYEIAKCFKHRICDLELVRLELVVEFYAAIDATGFKTTNATVNQLARECEGGAQ